MDDFGQSRKKNILIVDDNPGIVLNLKIFLEFNDFNILTAYDGKEALLLLKELSLKSHYPDLIISDIIMPELNGYDFFKIVSYFDAWNKIPFIFLSALSQPEDINLAKSLGVDDYITKPFKEDELLKIINSKLNSVHLFQVLDYQESDSNLFTSENNYYNDYEASVFLGYITENSVFIINTIPNSKTLEEDIKELILRKFYEIEKKKAFHYLNIENLGFQFLIYFDFNNNKSNNKIYFTGVKSTELNYFNAIKIKNDLKILSISYKNNKSNRLDLFYTKINQNAYFNCEQLSYSNKNLIKMIS